MRARRLLALVLALATFGLADAALGHVHPALAGAEAALAATKGAPAASGTRCVVCLGVSTWRAGAAPAAAPAARVVAGRALRLRVAAAPILPVRRTPTSAGPRAPPASR